jgi:hypothetical protein
MIASRDGRVGLPSRWMAFENLRLLDAGVITDEPATMSEQLLQ